MTEVSEAEVAPGVRGWMELEQVMNRKEKKTKILRLPDFPTQRTVHVV